MRHFKRAGVLSGLLVLGACTTNHGVSPPVVVKAPETFTNSFESMTFKVLPADEQVRLTINNEDQSFQFAGGNSFYEALSLPDLSQPYILTIESEVVTSAADTHGELFFPVLTFLDANKQNLMTLDALPYILQEPLTERNYMQASVRISDQLASARYVVLHTQDDKLELAIARGDGQTLLRTSGYQTMLFAPATRPRYRVNFSRDGLLRVKAALPSVDIEKATTEYSAEGKYY